MFDNWAKPRYPTLAMPKVRLDVLLVERGLAESRERAQALVRAGDVLVDDGPLDKPGMLVPSDANLRVRAPLRYVSRGGLKLEAALAQFGVDVAGKTAVDVGASTGGFTDCLLQHGAAHVTAIDVGYGQIAWSLRNDPRVTVVERTNIRYFGGLPEPADLAVIDVSFISLELVLPKAIDLLKPSGEIIALIKPQFEAGKEKVGKGGVVRVPAVHREVLSRVLNRAQGHGLAVLGLVRSPIEGPAGNVEFLAHFSRDAGRQSIDIEGAIEAVLWKAP